MYFEMLHGRPPWNAKSEFDLTNNIQYHPLSINQNLSAQSKDFLNRCLAITEKNRMSWDELFMHPIFKGQFAKKGEQEFENKLKTMMSDLRFQVNSKNIDLCKVFAQLGYRNGKEELNKEQFYQFLRVIFPKIERDSSDYIFNKADTNRDGAITINEIEKIMNQNSISLSTLNKTVPGFAKNNGNVETFTTLSEQVEKKIKSCFMKLMREMKSKHNTLKAIFEKFDTKKMGTLNRAEFSQMLKSITPDLTNEEIDAAFSLIDEDNSNTISFEEFNLYYKRVNGIPDFEFT
jgi:calcium-dependent protein kinase